MNKDIVSRSGKIFTGSSTTIILDSCYDAHLNGIVPIKLNPAINGKTEYSVVDITTDDGTVDSSDIIRLSSPGIPTTLFDSANGCRLYLFYNRKVSINTAVEQMRALIKLLDLESIGKCKVYPNTDGDQLELPYFNHKKPSSSMITQVTGMPIYKYDIQEALINIYYNKRWGVKELYSFMKSYELGLSEEIRTRVLGDIYHYLLINSTTNRDELEEGKVYIDERVIILKSTHLLNYLYDSCGFKINEVSDCTLHRILKEVFNGYNKRVMVGAHRTWFWHLPL